MYATNALVVPFATLPRKEWHDQMEVKQRLSPKLYTDTKEVYDAGNDDNYSDDYSESSVDSMDSYFSLDDHISRLMPSSAGNFSSLSRLHLDDMRVKPRKKVLGPLLKSVTGFFSDWRENEIRRRKDHMIREYEEQVLRYDQQRRQQLEKQMREQRDEILLENYRREMRIQKNSAVTVRQEQLIEQFTRSLAQRDKEAQKVEFRSTVLKDWAVDAHYKKEARDADNEAAAQADRNHRAAIAETQRLQDEAAEAERQRLLEDRLDFEVHTMMLRYGTIRKQRQASMTDSERVDDIISRAASMRSQKERIDRTRSDASVFNSSTIDSHLDDNLRRSIDTELHERMGARDGNLRLAIRSDKRDMKEVLRKNAQKLRNKRLRKVKYTNPFDQDLSGTGDIQVLRAVNIGEHGALCLASELTRGACPMVERLSLKGCEVHNSGCGKVLQAIKIANLMNIRYLNLRANHLTATSLDYMREVYTSGVLANVLVIDLSDNELGDDGVDALLRLILQGHLRNVEMLFLNRNSITDVGFVKVLKTLNSVQQAKLPRLQRLTLENNLITPKTRRKFAPLAAYLSV